MDNYLNRGKSNNDKKTEEYFQLLKSTVDFGAKIIGWSADLGTKFAEVLPVLPLLHKNIETTDSASVLIKNGIEDSTIPLIRVAVENCFYLKYILQDNSERRAKAFVYCYFRDQIRIHKRFLKETPQNKDLESKLKKGNKYDIPDYSEDYSNDEIKKLVKTYQNFISQDLYKEIREAENKKKKNYPEWYSLFGGPNNVEVLSQEVGLSSWYQVYYRHFSGNIHHDNLLSDTLRFDNGKPEIQLPYLRSYDQLGVFTQLFISINLEVFQDYLEHFLPTKIKKYQRWYVDEIRESYLNIDKI